MATRTIKAAGGVWGTASTWVEGIVPTEADDVVCEPTSATLTINNYSYCRSLDLTGFSGIFACTYYVYIGTTTNRADKVAVYIPDNLTYTGTTRLVLVSKSAELLTLSTGVNTKLFLYIELQKGHYIFVSDIYAYNLQLNGQYVANPLTVDLNNRTVNLIAYFEVNYLYASASLLSTTFNFSSVSTGSFFNIYAGVAVAFGNTIINTYAASFTVMINTVNTVLDGTSINIYGVSGTVAFLTNCTIENLRLLQQTIKTLSVTSGKTVTVTNQFICYPKNGLVTFAGGGTISKPSGTVNLYHANNLATLFTGGAAWIGRNNCASPVGYGIDLQGGTCYIDAAVGDDSLFMACGWWKAAYSLASGMYPAEGETATGSISGSTCKITGLVDDYDWNLGSGILYFYGKSTPFQAETVNLSGGGSFVITGDLVNSAWYNAGHVAITGKMGVKEIMKFAKTPDPVSTGVLAQWNSTTVVGYGIATVLSITSSSNTSPIVITKATHLYQTGAVVVILNHTVNTNANGVWKITKLTDNTFSLDGSVGNGVGAATGTINDVTSKTVALDTPVTEAICNCDLAWTPGTNVTSVLLDATLWKFSAGSIKIITGASCGANQIIAKYALAADLNLSGYEQISFWFRNATAAMAAGDLRLKLYSDAACTIEVESFPLPATPATQMWWPIVLNKEAALSATVRGVALYTTIVQASKTFNIDNIIACKSAASPDSITHQSYISKNILTQDGDDVFLGIQGIKGNYLFLDTHNNTTPITGRGYCGITERVMLYKRESQKTAFLASQYTASTQVRKSGAIGKNIMFTGGWNKITGQRDGVTHYDGLNGWGYGFYGLNFQDVENFHFSRYSTAVRDLNGGTGKDITLTNCLDGYYMAAKVIDIIRIKVLFAGSLNIQGTFDYCSGCVVKSNSQGVSFGAGGGTLLNLICDNNQAGLIIGYSNTVVVEVTRANFNFQGVYFNGSFGKVNTVLECNYNQTGVYFAANSCKVNRIAQLNYNSAGVSFGGSRNVISEITQLNNSIAFAINVVAAGMENGILRISSANSNKVFASLGSQINSFIHNATVTNTVDAAPIVFANASTFFLKNCTGLAENVTIGLIGLNSKLYSHNHNNSGKHKIFCEQGLIESTADERHTASGYSWKFSILHIQRTIVFPLNLVVAKIACNAGKTTTVAIWAKLSHEVNIGGMLVVEGDKYGGIGPSDIYAETAMTTEWQQIFIEFTPTYTDVVEVQFWVYQKAGATAIYSVWIDDVSIIEAP